MQTTDEKLIKAIYQSSPVIHFCNRFSGSSPLWDYTRHKHPYFEFIYHLRGNVRRKTDDLTVQNANIFDTILYPADCWHQDAATDSKKEDCHHLREVICIWAAFPGIHLDKPVKVQDQNGMLEHLFSALYTESQKISPSPELLSLQIRTLFLQILILSNESSNTLVNHVMQYLNFYSKENISIETLAEQVHVSKSYLVKQFKEKTSCHNNKKRGRDRS